VAENEILGEASVRGRAKGIDIIDSLADVGAFGKKVLIDIRDLAGVGVESGLTATEPGKAGSIRREQTDGGARLQDRVALDDPTRFRIKAGPVERMRHRPDELSCGVARQGGIGVKGDDVADRGGVGRLTDDGRKGIARTAAEILVELLELAALALVSHPAFFMRIPEARAMEEMENGRTAPTVAGIELRDALARKSEQRGIAVERFRCGIGKIGEQGKGEIAIAVADVAQFDSF